MGGCKPIDKAKPNPINPNANPLFLSNHWVMIFAEPNIKDPWLMPSIDVDAILIAIRIATYGEKMEIETRVPTAATMRKFDLDLRMLLDKYQGIEYDNLVEINGMKITLRPQNYREFTRTAIKTFEEQRIAETVSNSELSDGEKLDRFSESFNKLTQVTIDMVVHGIVQIQVDDQVVVDQDHIMEFITKGDKDFYAGITAHMEAQKHRIQCWVLATSAMCFSVGCWLKCLSCSSHYLLSRKALEMVTPRLLSMKRTDKRLYACYDRFLKATIFVARAHSMIL